MPLLVFVQVLIMSKALISLRASHRKSPSTFLRGAISERSVSWPPFPNVGRGSLRMMWFGKQFFLAN